VEKKYKEPDSGALQEGNRVHKAFELRIGSNTPLPADLAHHEDAMARLAARPGRIIVEHQMAIREDLSPCGWFANDTWYRAKGDYINIAPNERVALAIDYKTGKIIEEIEQLALMAECIFSHFPKIEAVRTEFWWMKDDASTREDFYRKDRHKTWEGVLPKVMELRHAHETLSFPPTQNGLCKRHCIVKGCPHWGGGGN
jgi:hypothetical protein